MGQGSALRPEQLTAVRPDVLSRRTVGLSLVLASSIATTLLGVAYVLLAAMQPLLPAESRYLGVDAAGLCSIEHCRLLDFFSHGRMSYGGALIAVGVMTGWLASGPLRRSEQWAWWTILLAGLATYGSFLTFFSQGYFDLPYVLFGALVSVLCGLGLSLLYPRRANLLDAFRSPLSRGWILSRGHTGHLVILLLGLGIGFSGLSILAIASSVVFVPQDITFLGVDSHEVAGINDRLMPLFAHDRAGYGGTMVAIGILFGATAWCGFRPSRQGAWYAVALAGFVFYASTLAIHLAIGYTDLLHLLPIYGGLAVIAMALFVLRGYLRPGRTQPGPGSL